MGRDAFAAGRRAKVPPWLVATGCLGLFAAIPLFLWLVARPEPSRLAGLAIEPGTVDLTGDVAAEGSSVAGRFRLTNRFGKPVLVKQFNTSCGCMGSDLEDGRKPPFIIAPGQAVAFVMKGHTAAQVDQVQTFYTSIISEAEGRALPEVTATLKCRVEDPLKPYPASIVLGSAPADRPSRHKITLATMSPATKPPAARVSTSQPESIRAELRPRSPDEVDGDGHSPRYDLDVTIIPRPGVEMVTGSIEVAYGERRTLIPVECAFRKPYRLSPATVEVEGRPGEVVTREVFYETSEPAWRDPKVIRAPRGVVAEWTPFDAATMRLTVRVTVPEQPASDPPDQVVALGFEGRADEIRIPVAVSAVR